MARTVVGVILGYVVMAVVVFCGLTAAYLAMGADGAFRPGTYEVSGLWIAISFIVGLAAAISGGWVCAAAATEARAPMILAAVVFVLGLAVAIPALTAPSSLPKPRLGDVPNLEAMANAHTPVWIALLNPFVGAAGVIVGGRLKRGTRV
jgi:hypothetical protein